MTVEAVLFGMIRGVVCGVPYGEELKNACTEEMLGQVYKLAARHDLAHLVGQAVSDMALPESETVKKAKKAAMSAFMRSMGLEQALAESCQILEQAQIVHIPLKGAVLRGLYPQSWMRTSCDVDILVKPEDLDRAVEALVQNLGYVAGPRGNHDITLRCPSGAHIELHFDLVEEGRANSAAQVLGRVWQQVRPRKGQVYCQQMWDGLFYFYHIAHMAKHFEVGGCGIRPFLDLWLLDRCAQGDRETTPPGPAGQPPHKCGGQGRTVEDAGPYKEGRIATGASALAMTQEGRGEILRCAQDDGENAADALLEEGGLLTFARAARKLSRVWFSGDASDELSEKLQAFLLHGGVYGSTDNRVALQQESRGGRLGYLRSRVFAPYEKLKSYYPVLEKHRWLTPLMQLRRWGMLLRPDVAGRTKKELAANSTNTKNTGSLLADLGIEDSTW